MSVAPPDEEHHDDPRTAPPTARGPNGPAGPERGPGRSGPVRVRWFWLVAGMLALNWIVVAVFFPAPDKAIAIPYSVFLTQVDAGNIVEVSAKGSTIDGKLHTDITYPPKGTESGAASRTGDVFRTQRPEFAEDDLLTLLQQHDVTISATPMTENRSLLESLLINLLPTVLLVGAMVWLWRRAAGRLGGGGIGGIGRSKAELYTPKTDHTTFADVAGIDEAVKELAEVVDYLKNPDSYRKLGATTPKGVLLTGPPGTGKTLLARALAGEAGVPFFSMAASEFIEMIVGVGASRVRDLFDKARAAAPSIVFIDELDAVGRTRGGSVSFGGHDEREQTLNQILTEMDGFNAAEGVIVLAATNRPEILDPALLRPGRFDRHVAIYPPDLVGRLAILRVHTRSVPLAPETDLQAVATATPGMVGADLRNLVNESALTAARRKHPSVQPDDFSTALERVVLGTEHHLVLTLDERTRTAVHESGHALLAMLLEGADPVRKISIIPRGRALGVTFQSPEHDRYSYPRSYLRGRIVGALGGRAAEELVLGEPTSGAESDLETATAVARQMIGRWGMSDTVGAVSIFPDNSGEDPMLLAGASPLSDETRAIVDREVRNLIEDAHSEARRTLEAHRDKLERLVAALLVHETLDEQQAYDTAGVPHVATRLQAPEPGATIPPAVIDANGVGVSA